MQTKEIRIIVSEFKNISELSKEDQELLTTARNKLEDAYPAVDASDSSFGHSGYTGTFAWADPEENLIFIFFSNRVHPTRNNGKLYDLNLRPELHQAIYDCIKEGL